MSTKPKATLVAGSARISILQNVLRLTRSGKFRDEIERRSSENDVVIPLKGNICDQALIEFKAILTHECSEEDWKPLRNSSVPILFQTLQIANDYDVQVVIDVLNKYFFEEAENVEMQEEDFFAVEYATRTRTMLFATNAMEKLREIACVNIKRYVQQLKRAVAENTPLNWSERLWKAVLSSYFLPDVREIELFEALLRQRNATGFEDFESLKDLVRYPLMTEDEFLNKVMDAEVLDRVDERNTLKFIKGNETSCRFNSFRRNAAAQFQNTSSVNSQYEESESTVEMGVRLPASTTVASTSRGMSESESGEEGYRVANRNKRRRIGEDGNDIGLEITTPPSSISEIQLDSVGLRRRLRLSNDANAEESRIQVVDAGDEVEGSSEQLEDNNVPQTSEQLEGSNVPQTQELEGNNVPQTQEQLERNNVPETQLQREDSNFSLVRHLSSSSNSSTASASFSFNIKSPAAIFTGREYEVERLESAFKNGGLLIVSAIGGQGKTELASQFVKNTEHFKFTPVRTWFCLETPQLFTNDVVNCCKKLKIKTTIRSRSMSSSSSTLSSSSSASLSNKRSPIPVSELLQSLANTIKATPAFKQGGWIVILDNVDGKYPEIRGILDTFLNAGAFVMITTRRTDISHPKGTDMELGPLDQDDAIKLVMSLVSNAEKGEARRLCEILANHVLALQQAAAYIKYRQRTEQSFKVDAYIAQFKNGESLGFEDDNPEIQTMIQELTSYNQTICRIVRTTMERIRTENADEPEFLKQCEDLMKILSVVLPDGIPVHILSEFLKMLEYKEEDEDCEGIEVNSSDEETESETADESDDETEDENDDSNLTPLIQKALAHLKNFGLIRVDGKFVSIHRFTQIATTRLWKPEDTLSKILTCFNIDGATKGELQHIIHVWDQACHFPDLVAKFPKTAGRIVDDMKEFGMARQITDFAEKNYNLFKTLPQLGPDCDETAKMKLKWSRALHFCGKCWPSLKLLKELYADALTKLGETNKWTLRLAFYLAENHWQVGHHQKALEIIEKLIENRTTLGEDWGQLVKVYHLKALILRYNKRKVGEALKLFQKVLKWEEDHGGCTYATRHNFALCLYDKGRKAEAKAEMDKAVDKCVEIFGEDDIITLWSKSCQAVMAYKIGGREEKRRALELMTKVVQSQEKILGPKHPEVIEGKKYLNLWKKRKDNL